MLESLWTEREQLRARAAAIHKDAAEHWLARNLAAGLERLAGRPEA